MLLIVMKVWVGPKIHRSWWSLQTVTWQRKRCRYKVSHSLCWPLQATIVVSRYRGQWTIETLICHLYV